ncbi:hypothetical protein D9M68_863570 [compost metagenome]
MLAIEPKEALLVEASPAALHSLEAKLFNKLIAGKYFLFGTVVPPHARKEVEHCFGQDPLIFVFLHALCTISLAELLFAVRRHDVRQTCKYWPLDFKGVIKRKIFWNR